jgi:hypothetical protein
MYAHCLEEQSTAQLAIVLNHFVGVRIWYGLAISPTSLLALFFSNDRWLPNALVPILAIFCLGRTSQYKMVFT